MRKILLSLILTSIILSSCSHPIFPVVKVIENCLSIQTNIPSISKFDGSLILDNGELFTFEKDKLVHKYLLEKYNDNNRIIIWDDEYISPDRKKLVYTDYEFNHLFLLTQGNVEKEIIGLNELGRPIGWFDNERLLFSPPNDRNGSIILYNPSTSEKRKVITDINNFSTTWPLPLWYRSENPLPIYNSTLTRAFYLSDNDGMVYSLWDSEKKESIWNRPIGDPYSKPQWSPDGKHIVVALRKELSNPHQVELFWIDLQGNETQLTNISDEYNSVYIGDFQWSPDGERIAFWFDYSLNVDDEIQPRLAVLDIKRGTLIDYCDESDGSYLVWSPDGKKIAFSNQHYSKPSDLVILDIEKQQANYFAKSNYFPIVWLK